jgi:hypothetical protein
MSQRDPDRRTILIEAAVYALMFVLVGALFVAMRALREGPRVMNFDVQENSK